MTRKRARAAALRGIHTSNGNDVICLRTDLYEHVLQSCRAKHNNQEKTTHSLKEGVTKIFRVVNLFTGSIFAIILIYFALWCNSVHTHGHHCPSSPMGEVRILCTTATRAHFVVINKGARHFYLSSDTRKRPISDNTFFLSWKQRTVRSRSRWKCIAIFIKMYVAGVWAKTAMGYFKNVKKQVILLQSKVWSNL